MRWLPAEAWVRNQYVMVATVFVVFTGFAFVLPFLPLYVRELGVPDEERAALWAGVLIGVAPLLAGLLAPVWGRLADRYGQKGIAVRVELDGAGEAPCPVSLERVIQNLLVNAVRHTDDGEVVLTARVEVVDVVIEVRDTGEGMPEGQLPMVFEPFWRGDAARASPGSGLGLTLARRLVEHLGGEIDVTSRQGQGSRFTVRVPIQQRS